MNKVISSKDEFFFENEKMSNALPYSEAIDVLKEGVELQGKYAPNRLLYQAMEGCDGTSDGRPDELTQRRYTRFAKGGAGTIWFEATAVMPEARANPRQLYICKENSDSFKALIESIKETAMRENGHEPLVIMQATHSGRYSKPNGKPEPLVAYNKPIFEKDKPIDKSRVLSDDRIKEVSNALVFASQLAENAGFDGVDIKCCHGYLNNELLSAYNREGIYGRNFENRTRLLVESVEGAFETRRKKDFIITSRLNIYDGFPYPYGFGISADGSLNPDFTEPIALVKKLSEVGMTLLNITMGNPYVNPHVNRPFAKGGYISEEHPLAGVARMLEGTSEIKRSVPDMKIVCSGLSFLGVAAPNVASAYISSGCFDFAGFGRTAFAYPDFAKDVLIDGSMKKDKICLACSKCTELMRAGSVTGCVVRDKEVYLPLYKKI